MSAIDILLIVGGVGYVLVRRVIGQLLEIKGLLVAPVALTIVGIVQLRHAHPVDATTVAFVAGGVVLSVVIGLIRGRTVHLGSRDGQLWMRYRASTLGLWVVNLALKAVTLPIEHAISSASTSAADRGILLAIGLGILAETAVVLLRAMDSDAAVAWEKGRDGGPHAASPAFERARSYVQETGSLSAAGKRLRAGHHDW